MASTSLKGGEMGNKLKKGAILFGNNDEYLIDKIIGQGGVGLVYKGKSISKGDKVAIKVLSGGRFDISDRAIERFKKEAKITLKLQHGSIVKHLDSGKHRGVHFIVMEFIDGCTLANKIEKGSYGYKEAFKWFSQVISGIMYIHSKEIIHRDLKPNNILIDLNNNAKIADFGIVRNNTQEAYLTITGDQMGSVLYISRAQRQHPEEFDYKYDVHSISCCIYETFSKQRIHPFCTSLENIKIAGFHKEIAEVVSRSLKGNIRPNILDMLYEYFSGTTEQREKIAKIAKTENLKESAFTTALLLGTNIGGEQAYEFVYDFIDNLELEINMTGEYLDKEEVYFFCGIVMQVWDSAVTKGIKILHQEYKKEKTEKGRLNWSTPRELGRELYYKDHDFLIGSEKKFTDIVKFAKSHEEFSDENRNCSGKAIEGIINGIHDRMFID